jgi:hypothetical protein
MLAEVGVKEKKMAGRANSELSIKNGEIYFFFFFAYNSASSSPRCEFAIVWSPTGVARFFLVQQKREKM